MVEREHAPVQLSRGTHQISTSRNDNYLRCGEGPSGGLGSSLPRAFYRGSMVSTGKKWYINKLEMIAAELAIKTFTKGKNVKAIHLKVDNTTALSYIMKLGGGAQKTKH